MAKKMLIADDAPNIVTAKANGLRGVGASWRTRYGRLRFAAWLAALYGPVCLLWLPQP